MRSTGIGLVLVSILLLLGLQGTGDWLNGGNPIAVQGDIPTGRAYHAAAVIDSGPSPRMIIHGGYRGFSLGHEGSMYFFQFADLTWTELTPICNPPFSCPTPRKGHLGVYTPNHGFIILGGFNDTASFSEVWAYNPTTNVWTRLPDMPENRQYFAGCYHPTSNSIYVHGGMIFAALERTTLWRLDLDTMEWSEIDYTIDGLPPNEYKRFGHTCTCARSSTIICHAGCKNNSLTGVHTKDTYIFDPETNHFSQVEAHPEMEGRLEHAVAYVERPYPQTDLLFMHGGSNFLDTFNDLWVMDTNVEGPNPSTSETSTGTATSTTSTTSTSSTSASFTSTEHSNPTEVPSEFSGETTSNSDQTANGDTTIDIDQESAASGSIGIFGVTVAVYLVLLWFK